LIRRSRIVANSALASGLRDRCALAMHQPERGGVESESAACSTSLRWMKPLRKRPWPNFA
jgi:hypothetical protein